MRCLRGNSKMVFGSLYVRDHSVNQRRPRETEYVWHRILRRRNESCWKQGNRSKDSPFQGKAVYRPWLLLHSIFEAPDLESLTCRSQSNFDSTSDACADDIVDWWELDAVLTDSALHSVFEQDRAESDRRSSFCCTDQSKART